MLEREGIPTEGYHSKSWDKLPVTPDIVITVCGSAAGETCPAYLGPVMRAHWGVEDPAHATGTDEEVDAAFMKAYRILRHRIEALQAIRTHEEVDLRREQQHPVVHLRAARHDGDVEAVFSIRAVGDCLIEAAVFGLRDPVGAERDLVELLRFRRSSGERQTKCGERAPRQRHDAAPMG